MTDSALPKYDHPPVVETILGVQFEPIAGLHSAHLGAFWATLGAEWPSTEEATPLEPQFERFDDGARWAELGLRLRLSALPQPRIRIRNAANNRMIQLQNGRFIVNWLGVTGEPYPNYETIRDDFTANLDRFCDFLANVANLPLPTANQWEVTYLNHIPKGTVWNTPAEWDFFLPLQTRMGLKHAHLESYSGEWQYVVPPQRGRLHVHWQHGQSDDQRELIVLNLTARGPCNAPKLDAGPILEGLNLGRETIVQSFRDLMSDAANHYWGLQHVT
jgi:uncharacterized protein (TIGR04255 family)